jgi:hypothetical protein
VKSIVIALVTLGIFSILFVGFGSAQTYQTTPKPFLQQQTNPQRPTVLAPAGMTGSYADVRNLKPFTAEADYMSLAGYLRYLTHQRTTQWLTHQEAERIVRQ